MGLLPEELSSCVVWYPRLFSPSPLLSQSEHVLYMISAKLPSSAKPSKASASASAEVSFILDFPHPPPYMSMDQHRC